jgi:HAD superfamily hydrolase (TIGR01509 family)
MIKLIIFDLDGVLIDAKNIHYEALNQALGDEYAISWSEHLSIYDGLKTNQKLQMLTQHKNLPIELHEKIWEKKQQLTLVKLKEIEPSTLLLDCFSQLVQQGYKIGVCSNSIRKTVLTVLGKLGLIEFVDLILSNEDVLNSKPHPEMYWTAISKMSVLPEETLIVEDSPYGLLAASRAKAHILRVKNAGEVTWNLICNKIQEIDMGQKQFNPKWVDKNLNVLIPMAGAGTRFQQAGYSFPKPLIDVDGKPMIQLVVENLNIDANYIYLVQKAHREKYNLDILLNLLTPGCTVIDVDGLTEGAACTALLAKNFINNDNPLFFANSDQFVEWDSNEFFYKMNESEVGGGIPTFRATHPKWSFARLDDDGYVVEVQEKKPISDHATVGFYYWRHGKDFVKYAEEMIAQNIRVNNEFYVCPVYNNAINDGLKVRTFDVEKMWGLGTPEDLDYYLKMKVGVSKG